MDLPVKTKPTGEKDDELELNLSQDEIKDLLEDQKDLMDFTEEVQDKDNQVLADIEKNLKRASLDEPMDKEDNMEEDEATEDNAEDGAESGKTPFADAAKKRPQKQKVVKVAEPTCYEVLHVQSGSNMRAPLLEDDWNKIWALFHDIWMEKLMSDNWDPNVKVEWSTWLNQSGLIACKNEETMIFIRNLVADIKFEGKVFRAWKRKEFGFPHLVTLFLPPPTNVIPEDKTLLMWRKQNGLMAGEMANPRFKAMDKPKGCRLVTFGANEQLLERVKNLGGVAYLGFSKIKVHTKAKDTGDSNK